MKERVFNSIQIFSIRQHHHAHTSIQQIDQGLWFEIVPSIAKLMNRKLATKKLFFLSSSTSDSIETSSFTFTSLYFFYHPTSFLCRECYAYQLLPNNPSHQFLYSLSLWNYSLTFSSVQKLLNVNNIYCFWIAFTSLCFNHFVYACAWSPQINQIIIINILLL